MIDSCGGCPFFGKGQPLKPGQHMAVCEKALTGERLWVRDDQSACDGMRRSTLEPMWWPLMRGPTVKREWCVVCGRTYPLNQHHPVKQSGGNLMGRDGIPLEKPTLTLCGSGNTSGCHRLAHEGRLFFRYEDGQWEYLLTREPVKAQKAFGMEGWRRIRD